MTCRSCGGKLDQAFSLGEQYLSDFRDDYSLPPKYRLDVALCRDCSLLQLLDTVPREKLYHDRYGFKSSVNATMRADLKDVVDSALRVVRCGHVDRWLDIACNDGTLLSYVPTHIYRAGVDPVRRLAEEARFSADLVVNDFFSPDQFDGKFDIITSISVFYDIEDLPAFVEGVAKLLAGRGIWVIQQNYLLETLKQSAIDNFCHEHLTYFSLLSLEPLLDRFGLEVIRAKVSGVNGGSLRTFVAHKGEYIIDGSVAKQRLYEDLAELDSLETYEEFAGRARQNVKRLLEVLSTAKRVYIYGASTRGATLWQLAGVKALMAVERNPEKVGKIYSALGIPIISEDRARRNPPSHMLVGPWWCRDEFVEREKKYLDSGGKMIFPLPEVEVVG
jgi:hypothetical protein